MSIWKDHRPEIGECPFISWSYLVGKNPPGKLLTEPDGVLRAEDETKAAYSGRLARSPRLLGR